MRLMKMPAILIGLMVVVVSEAAPVRHPLDPLKPEEIRTVTSVLTEAGHVDEESRFVLINLHEPPKSAVLQWRPGGDIARSAFVVAMNGPQTFEAVVDLHQSRVESWKEIKDVQPTIVAGEWEATQRIVRSNEQWQAAISKRGFPDPDEVVCVPLSAGYFGDPADHSRRLLKVPFYDGRGVKNFWGRPIEGLLAVVDLTAGEMVELIDTGQVPVPQGPIDFDQRSARPLRQAPHSIFMSQPEKRSFDLNGHVVRWQKWQFHIRIDPRVGPVISLVRYQDGDTMRSILYQASLSELAVAYMDDDLGWYFRTFIDAGEFGVGTRAAPLQVGKDCPKGATIYNPVFATVKGQPYAAKQGACLFERYAGDPIWRHHEGLNRSSEVRKNIELVFRFIASIGNYDYILDWVFRQDGTIRVMVGATGIVQAKGVKSRTNAEDPDGGDTSRGQRIAEHTVGINHDHHLNFRIDLDVDGTANSFVREALKPKRLDPGHPRKSLWVTQQQVPATELQGKMRIKLQAPALWRVINPAVIGPFGNPVSFHLKPRGNAVSLLDEDDYPRRRLGFIDNHLWITPYHADERYAAGAYPNQSRDGDGLPRWTTADRPIENTDIVLWYTLNFHHVVRTEDWPVMPVNWQGFDLRPFHFFDRNPALDLPDRE